MAPNTLLVSLHNQDKIRLKTSSQAKQFGISGAFCLVEKEIL